MCTLALPGCATLDEFLAELGDDSDLVYVQEPYRPAYYDPYYNQQKFYREPRYYQPQYYETETKKKKGDKVTKTKTVRNEYGDVVYKEKTTTQKKKKK